MSNSIQQNGKRRQSSGLHVRRHASREVHIQKKTKHKIGRPSYVNSLLSHAGHYETPIGCQWSQNSCAYDSVFTPIFVLCCGNRDYWAQVIRGMGNAVADLLVEGFSFYERGDTSLKDVCDDARQLVAHSPNGTAFSFYTSIENVFAHLQVTEKQLYCLLEILCVF